VWSNERRSVIGRLERLELVAQPTASFNHEIKGRGNFMELSRKEKFGTIKQRKTRKWPKVLLASIFALLLGATSVIATNPNLADYLYKEVISYTFQQEIEDELNKEKQFLLADLSKTIAAIFTKTKEELDEKKEKIIEDEKAELKAHYNQEIATISARKQDAIDKKTAEMSNAADSLSAELKTEISEAIETEAAKAKMNK
jgi:hypothetical protein